MDQVREALDEGNRLYDGGKLAEAEAAYHRGWNIRKTFQVAVQLGAVDRLDLRDPIAGVAASLEIGGVRFLVGPVRVVAKVRTM